MILNNPSSVTYIHIYIHIYIYEHYTNAGPISDGQYPKDSLIYFPSSVV